MPGDADIADLLQHSAWMRRLAMSLVRDRAAADDLVQETWVAALRHAPLQRRTARAWLGEVLRNLMRAKLRAETRRARREEVSVDADAHSPSADQLVGSVELQRLLAEEVVALDEPYRSTLLSRFYDGLSSAEIAQREALPAGTVRWRLKEGLDQLRAKLDRKHPGGRDAWLRAMAPLAHKYGAAAPVAKGVLLMKLGALLAVVAAVGLFALRPKSQAKATAATVQGQARQNSPRTDSLGADSLSADSTRTERAEPPHARLNPRERADLLRRIEAARRQTEAASNTATGTLDPKYIQEQIRELLPLIKECFENALEHHPNLSGRVVVGFSIVGDPSVGGVVADSQAIDEKSTIKDKDLRECIQENMYAARFPPPTEGGELRVEYPFVLMPPDEEPQPSNERR